MPEHESSGDPILDRRFQWAQASLEAGDVATAAGLLTDICEAAPAWAAGWYHLALAREQAGATGAAEAVQRYLSLDPADRLGGGLLAARLGLVPAAAAMSPSFVGALFDAYAPRFDRHLLGELHYTGPEVVRDAIRAACAMAGRAPRFARALDLGCGTGLMGAALAGMVGHLAGADLSAGMLAGARASGHYAELHQQDIVAALAEASAPDLVTAADVLVYVGDLAPLFAMLARRLAPGGMFAATVQTGDGAESGFGLGRDARYFHASTYVADTAARSSLRVVHAAQASTRRDRGLPVPGMVFVLGPA